jgi:hypothetical protein
MPRRVDQPERERTFWELVPRRNLRRVVFLIVAILAVVALKRAGGGAFRNLLDAVSPSAPGARSPAAGSAPFSPLRVVRPPAANDGQARP